MDLIFRFLVGGLVVSVFAILADALKPKSFAGILSAAPSVALTTICLTVQKSGKIYAATEARSMILGAIAFLLYAHLVSRLMMRRRWPALSVAGMGLLPWFCFAIGLWYAISALR